MKTLTLSISLLLLALPLTPVKASFFGRHQNLPKSLTTRESSFCGSHHMPCPIAEPCCNNGTCHTTSMEACPISLGCDPTHSHVEGCFPLPACRNIKDQFKQSNLLIPKQAFTGDPNQAHWISDFHHIAPYAKIDHHNHKLLLHTRRDMVKTQSGGGFGATVSSTRWNKYGTFTAKFRSGATGPGIVTAFLLSNPALGEEISFELTGRDPKRVITNYYRRVRPTETLEEAVQHRLGGNNGVHGHNHRHQPVWKLDSHEESHELKRDSTKHDLVYKIEWTDKMIRWSVDGKVLRTVLAKDALGGLPENPMQLQLTVWDAGHAVETRDWAGGKTDYGPDNLDEYITTVDSIEVSCFDSKEGNKPWPGPDALKRLKKAQALEAEMAKRYRKMNKGKKGGDTKFYGGQEQHGYGHEEGYFARMLAYMEMVVLSLIKWTFMLLALVCGAAYFTQPKTTESTTRTSPSSSSQRNLGL
ncbi:glycoside hydrolase family 16 protein [Linnemannia elongata AG-77]|uniref:Glycoside hydrolase family 16 protein n=1 Tax=Linnemannia elongata AG-77 TaxID=1314771 RepID=A0A197K8U8_9FUNG|nr:glycoside hydrolase family 16 protein [Linnemannia elongata AG-77]